MTQTISQQLMDLRVEQRAKQEQALQKLLHLAAVGKIGRPQLTELDGLRVALGLDPAQIDQAIVQLQAVPGLQKRLASHDRDRSFTRRESLSRKADEIRRKADSEIGQIRDEINSLQQLDLSWDHASEQLDAIKTEFPHVQL